MDPKRALKTHTALFKTRRAYHVHGYWREKEVWIPRELSRLTRHFLRRGGHITCMVTGERRKYGSQESSQDSHGTF